MPDAIELIEAALVALLEPVAGLAHALDHEPKALPRLSAGNATATLMWRTVQPVDDETGPGEDVSYSWNVNLYVSLVDFKAAQAELKQLVPRVIAILRPDPTLGRLVDFCRWRDLDGEPVLNPKQGYIRKTLVVTADLEEF